MLAQRSSNPPTTAYLESCDIRNQDYDGKFKAISISVLGNTFDAQLSFDAPGDALNDRLTWRRRDELTTALPARARKARNRGRRARDGDGLDRAHGACRGPRRASLKASLGRNRQWCDRARGDEPRIGKSGFAVEERSAVAAHHRAARGDEHGVSGRGVPFHRGSEARI